MRIVLSCGERLVELFFGTDVVDTSWPTLGSRFPSELAVVVVFFGTDIVELALFEGGASDVLCLAAGETGEVSFVMDVVVTVVYKVDLSWKVRFRKSLPNLFI